MSKIPWFQPQWEDFLFLSVVDYTKLSGVDGTGRLTDRRTNRVIQKINVRLIYGENNRWSQLWRVCLKGDWRPVFLEPAQALNAAVFDM